MVTRTIIQSYEEVKESIGIKQKIVLDGLKMLETANNQMIARFIKFPINSVTGRMNELREMKLVSFSHTAPCPYSKKQTNFYALTKWGKEMSEIIVDLKLSRLTYRPYFIEEGLCLTTFKAQSKDLDSKTWHNVEVIRYGDGRTKSICDCYDWNETKQKLENCKHISDLKNKLIENGEL